MYVSTYSEYAHIWMYPPGTKGVVMEVSVWRARGKRVVTKVEPGMETT